MFGLNDTPGIIVIALAGFLIVGGIMSLFIPFWIYRIRNEMIAANERLATLVQIIRQKPAK
jgi:hypothetical protein